MPGDAAGETVQVVYATPDAQRIVTIELEPGLTAAEAVRRSKLVDEFPEIAARPLALGIFGSPVDLDHVLEAGDRVEIARPLERDPRELRRELLKHGLVMGASGLKGGKDEA